MFGNNSGSGSNNPANKNVFNTNNLPSNTTNPNFSNPANTNNPQSTNIFAQNSNNANKNINVFPAGNTPNNSSQGNAPTPSNNVFTERANTAFGNNPPQNKVNNLFNNNANTANFNTNNANTVSFNNTSQGNKAPTFGNPPTQGGNTGTVTSIVKNTMPGQNAQNMGNVSGGIFGQPEKTNVVTNTQNTANNNTPNFFNKAQNNQTTQNTPSPPNTASGNTGNSAQTPGGNIFNTNTPPPASTPNNIANLFNNKNTATTGNPGNNPNTQTSNTGGASQPQPMNKPEQNNPQNQPTATSGTTGVNLFANNPAATTGTQPPKNLFNNQPAQTGANVGTGAVGSGQGTSGPTLTAPRDDAQIEFESSNQTFAEFIDEFRKNFLQTYDDLQKISESALRYLDQKEENQRLVRNFNSLEPMIVNKSDQFLRTLQAMQRQQQETQKTINAMSRKLGDDGSIHELSRHIEDYQLMKDEIMKLQEEGGDWSDPSNEQLGNIFESLNQVELQVKEMDDQVQRYLSSINSYL